jgi:hypothetical protein
VPQSLCKRCKGTGQESFGFLSVFSELNTKNEEESDDDDIDWYVG